MEWVSCNLCQGSDFEFLFKAKEKELNTGEYFNLVKCKSCGLVFVNPRPDEKEMKKYFLRNMWPRIGKNIQPEKATVSGENWKKVMGFRARPILKYRKRGKILDFGCGEGYFLKYMAEIGWEVFGLEPEEKAARYARDILGLNDISTLPLEGNRYPEKFFDVINLNHVLEHLYNPSDILKRLKSILKDDGLLVITVPNFGGFEAKLFKGDWFALMVPSHLYQFAPLTLKGIAERQNYRVLEIRHISSEGGDYSGYSESIRYFLRKYKLYPSRGSLSDLVVLKKNSISRLQRKKFWVEMIHRFENVPYGILAFFADRLSSGNSINLCAVKKGIK